MKLIIGNVIQGINFSDINSWVKFSLVLESCKIEKETVDCAFICCLRMSDSLTDVSQDTITQFIKECISEAFTLTQSGNNMPLEQELLEYSETNHDDQDKLS